MLSYLFIFRNLIFHSRWLILSALFAGTVHAQLYSADIIHSEWKVISNPFACSLTHNIPTFGQAVFSRKAGGDDIFYVESQAKVVFPVGNARVETLPPVWRSDLLPVVLGAVNTVAGPRPINLSGAQVAPVIAQLNTGMNIMYSSQPIANTSSSGSSNIRVVLNAKNFSAGYKIYQQCIADIIPYSFADVARTLISYKEKSTGLTPANKIVLGKVAHYINADPKVVGVFVDGHSDNSGTDEKNEATSKQEAEWVTAYLVAQGVTASKITTRWHSDKFAIANNKTSVGRAQNRRVSVRLEDLASQLKLKKQDAQQQKDAALASAQKATSGAGANETLSSENNTSSAVAASNAVNSAPTNKKMTPEEISKMVEGFNLKDPQQPSMNGK